MSHLPPFEHRILVLGDLILDEYLIGRATRLSREAPVPVLERSRRILVAGGAANPAVGICALGGRATLLGVTGAEAGAASLHECLTAGGVEDGGILALPERPTTTKSRIIAEGGFVTGQHLARIDVINRDPLPAHALVHLESRLEATVAGHEVLLVSDYKGGVVNRTTLAALRRLAGQHQRPLVVDSQGDLARFHGFDLVKCNRAEAEFFLGESYTRAPDEFLQRLRDATGAGTIVVTLGGEGIAWHDGQAPGRCQAPRAAVYDVTGAGDTVIAVLALARAAALPLAEGCRLAAHAAALTVRHIGNHAPTRADLIHSLTLADPLS